MNRKRRRPPTASYSPGKHPYKKRKASKSEPANIRILHDFLLSFKNKITDPKSVKNLANFLNKLERQYIETFSHFWKEIQTQPIGDAFYGQERLDIQEKFKELQKRREEVKLGGNLLGKLEAIFASDEQKRNAIKPRIDNNIRERINQEKVRQKLRTSAKAPVEKNTAQMDNGKKFWQMFEPLFEFQGVRTIESLLNKILSDAKPYFTTPPYGNVAHSIQNQHTNFPHEHGPKFGFEEERDTIWDRQSACCPLCERELQLKAMEARWSCDHFNHLGSNAFPAGVRVYTCPNERCDISMCENCYNRNFERNESEDQLRPFRLKSASSLLVNAFIQPGAVEWRFHEETLQRGPLDIPYPANPERLAAHKARPKPRPGKPSPKLQQFTLEQRTQMELKALGLFDSPSNFKPDKREDDEICLYLREKHDIFKEQLTRVREFYGKISTRCENHSKNAKKLKQLHEAQEDFLRATKDPTKTEEQLLEALEKFEAMEQRVGRDLTDLVKTPWMKNF